MTDILCLKELLNQEECIELLQFMLFYDEPVLTWQCIDVEYLIIDNQMPGSGLVTALSCDLSALKWDLLFKRIDLNLQLIEAIVVLGRKIVYKDIEIIIENVSEKNIAILTFALSRLSLLNDIHLAISLVYKVFGLQKFLFAEEVMKTFSSLLLYDDLGNLLYQALKLKNYVLIIDIINLKPMFTFTQLIKNILKLKKFNFLLELIMEGAVIHPAQIVDEMNRAYIIDVSSDIISYLKLIPEGRIQLFYKALEYGLFDVAESYLFKGTKETNTSKIDLNVILRLPIRGNAEERQKYIAFVKVLTSYGIDPNGKSPVCPLDTVLNFPSDYQREKVQLLLHLIVCGTTIGNSVYQKNSTTLLHIATRMSIESGMCIPVCKVLKLTVLARMMYLLY